MKTKTKPCLVACSVLRPEIEKLIQEGKLDADLRFVSKYFHVDYAQIEKNLRPVIENAIKNYPENVILVYGDLCLGMDNEMRKLAEEYGIVKIDALNCIDCQLGGKGKFLEAAPHQDIMFLTPGMTDFFSHAKEQMQNQGIDQEAFRQLYKGIRGIVVLDTIGNAEGLIAEVEKLDTGLKILETRQIGCEHVNSVIQEAIQANKKARERVVALSVKHAEFFDKP